MRILRIILPPVIVLVVLCIAVEMYLRWREVPAFLVPTPSDVAAALRDQREELLPALWQTAKATLVGFAASAVFGVVTAILLPSSRWVSRAVYPYTVFFLTMPVVAIAPMLIHWCDAGLLSIAICAFIVSTFPVITNTLSGLLSTDP